MVQKNPKNNWTKIYAMLYKSFALLVTLLANPEAFALALHTFGGPRIRNLLKLLRFLFRGLFVASLYSFGT